MIPIYKKELRTYFTQMTGYIFLTFMVLLTAIFFVMINVLSGTADFHYVLSNTTSIVLFIMVPVLTMRLFAEEARNKTDQLLYTSPLTVTQIVVGKFLAALTLYLCGVAVTCLFPFMLSFYGELPLSQIVGAYLGYILIGSCCIAVGVFVSVRTDNQIIAAVATFTAIFAMFIMDSVADNMPASTEASLIYVGCLIIALAWRWYRSTKNINAALIVGAAGIAIATAIYFINNLIYDGVIVKTLQWFSVYSRYNNLSNGILNVSDLVYYISFTALFIYMTVNVIEKRRWI